MRTRKLTFSLSCCRSFFFFSFGEGGALGASNVALGHRRYASELHRNQKFPRFSRVRASCSVRVASVCASHYTTACPILHAQEKGVPGCFLSSICSCHYFRTSLHREKCHSDLPSTICYLPSAIQQSHSTNTTQPAANDVGQSALINPSTVTPSPTRSMSTKT